MDIHLLYRTAMYPYLFQKQGSDFLARNTSAILADEPGLGKTLQAQIAADQVRARRILILCPQVAMSHWLIHFINEQKISRVVYALHNMYDIDAHKENIHGLFYEDRYPAVIIANYDLLSRADASYLSVLRRYRWDVLILDEAHYLKNSAANRTRAVYGATLTKQGGLAGRARFVWCLTGTPAPNHAGELYTHFHALNPEAIKHESYNRPYTQEEFENRFCQVEVKHMHGRRIRQIVGSRNHAMLRKRFDKFLMRRKTEQVSLELPPLRFSTEPLEWDLVTTVYQDRTPFRELNDAATRDGVDLDDPEAVLRFLSGRQTPLASQRRMTGMTKIAPSVALIRSELDGNNRKILVFAIHHAVIDQLAADLASYKPAVIDGRVSPADRDRAVRTFRDDPTVRVFIGQIQACGVALTLTAATQVLFVEYDWVPNNNFQAAKRAHRIGQTSSVLVRFLFMPDTIDDRILRVMSGKMEDIAQLMD